MAVNSRSMCIQLAAMEGTRSVRQQLAGHRDHRRANRADRRADRSGGCPERPAKVADVASTAGSPLSRT